MSQVRIAPSILAADFARLGEQIQDADAGGADLIHIDVMDGRFVPNITMGPLIVRAARRVTNLPLDVHLMIVEPERHLAAFAEAGASSISVHYEASPNLHRTLQNIHDLGCQAGVAINPHTRADALLPVLDMIDIVNVMTVNPGFGGQKLIPATLSKVEALRRIITDSGRSIALEVDGGVNAETVPLVVGAGADVLIAGSTIFNAQYPVKDGIKIIRNAID